MTLIMNLFTPDDHPPKITPKNFIFCKMLRNKIALHKISTKAVSFKIIVTP